MRISWKSVLISFALSLIVFSVVMTVVCISIFRSQVGVRVDGGNNEASSGLPSQTSRYDFSETRLYYSTNSDDDLRFAAFVGISQSQKVITLTRIDKKLPVNYKNAFYFVANIYGEQTLSDITYALTGILPDKEVDMRTYGFSRAEDMEEFCQQIESLMQDSYDGYLIEYVDVALDADGMADGAGTMTKFFVTESK